VAGLFLDVFSRRFSTFFLPFSWRSNSWRASDGYFAQLGRRLPDRIEHRQDLVGHRRNRFRQKQVKARASPNPTGQSALHPELRLNGQSRSFVKSGISD
jgi:hypothetical protein